MGAVSSQSLQVPSSAIVLLRRIWAENVQSTTRLAFPSRALFDSRTRQTPSSCEKRVNDKKRRFYVRRTVDGVILAMYRAHEHARRGIAAGKAADIAPHDTKRCALLCSHIGAAAGRSGGMVIERCSKRG